jgi:hypothetical protein
MRFGYVERSEPLIRVRPEGSVFFRQNPAGPLGNCAAPLQLHINDYKSIRPGSTTCLEEFGFSLVFIYHLPKSNCRKCRDQAQVQVNDSTRATSTL